MREERPGEKVTEWIVFVLWSLIILSGGIYTLYEVIRYGL